MYKIGIDLGGTKIEGVVLGADGKEIQRKRMKNGKEKGYDHILDNIHQLYTDLTDEINNEPHTLGLGTPGSMSKQTKLLKNSNILCMNGMPFQADLTKKLGHAIAVQNDANCFAMAEAILGAGKGKDMVFGVIMGTGCGGGIVYKGEVIEGMRENAGEWGHSIINYDAEEPEWYDGMKGPVEMYISGTGIQKRYEAKYNEEISTSDIVYNYRNGESDSSFIMDEFFENFGRSIANIIKFLDPDVIVLGGGVSNVDEIYTEGLKRVKEYCLDKDLYTPIVKNVYGDSAGVIGAALIGI